MLNIVFFGTPDIGLKSLEYLYNSDKFNVQAVVTNPDRPSGRGHKLMPSPIKVFALEHNIPVFQPKSIRKEPEIINALKELKPDFFVTFAFGQILSQEVLDIPKYETVNLHVSLLPKYRGANPIQRAIMNGETETGICTMITELGLDTGAICLTHPIEINNDMNCVELFEICSSESPKLLERTLLGIAEGTLTPTAQCENGVCYAEKLKKEECQIDWNKSAAEIHNLVRGVYKCPGAFFEHNGKIIKVMETEVVNQNQEGHPGDFISITNSGIDVQTGKGVLRLLRVKPEGKGEMSARDWSNGLHIT